MFARVSSYRRTTDGSGAPSEDTIQQVLNLPGCRAIYYFLGQDGQSMSITLWEDERFLRGSQEAADRIREATSAEQKLDILEVKEFEVLTQRAKN